MNYGSLIRESWLATWRHRSLWVLGLLAGGSGGNCSTGGSSNWPGGNGQPAPGAPEIDGSFDQVWAWLLANLWLIAVAVTLLVVLMLVWMILSLIAQGGMARATADLARGE